MFAVVYITSVLTAAALALLGRAKSISPSAPEPTIPDSIRTAVSNDPVVSVSHPIRNGVRTPEAEKKVTIIPVAAPADFENKSVQIE